MWDSLPEDVVMATVIDKRDLEILRGLSVATSHMTKDNLPIQRQYQL